MALWESCLLDNPHCDFAAGDGRVATVADIMTEADYFLGFFCEVLVDVETKNVLFFDWSARPTHPPTAAIDAGERRKSFMSSSGTVALYDAPGKDQRK